MDENQVQENVGSGDTVNTPKEEVKVEKTEKTFSRDEVNKMIATEKTKAFEEAKKQAEQEKEEAQKLAKLSADEREKVLLKKQHEELAKKEKEISLKEMKLTAIDILNNKSLPVNLVDFLICEDAEKTNSYIENFETAFRKAVEDAVNDRLRGEVPLESQSVATEQDAFLKGLESK